MSEAQRDHIIKIEERMHAANARIAALEAEYAKLRASADAWQEGSDDLAADPRRWTTTKDDRIAALRAENAKMREALGRLASAALITPGWVRDTALAALQQEQGGCGKWYSTPCHNLGAVCGEGAARCPDCSETEDKPEGKLPEGMQQDNKRDRVEALRRLSQGDVREGEAT